MYRQFCRFIALCIVSGSLVQSTSAASTALAATQTERDTLGISAALIFLTLIQFLIAGTYIFRFKRNHLLPGLIIIFALFITLIYFALYTLFWLSLHIVNTDDFFQPQIFSNDAISALFFASGYFSDWTDPITLLAIVFVIWDRYTTYIRSKAASTSPENPSRPFSLIHIFLAIFIFLAIANFIFGTASISLLGEAQTEDGRDFQRKAKQGDDFLFAQQSFNSLMIVLLIPFALVVRKFMPKDKIMNYVLFGILPILFLRFIGGIVLLAYLNKPLSFNMADELALAFLVVPGFAYFFVFSILCYLLLMVDLWLGPGEEITHAVQYAQFPGSQWGHIQPPMIQPQPSHPLGNAQWVQQPRTIPMV